MCIVGAGVNYRCVFRLLGGELLKESHVKVETLGEGFQGLRLDFLANSDMCHEILRVLKRLPGFQR